MLSWQTLALPSTSRTGKVACPSMHIHCQLDACAFESRTTWQCAVAWHGHNMQGMPDVMLAVT